MCLEGPDNGRGSTGALCSQSNHESITKSLHGRLGQGRRQTSNSQRGNHTTLPEGRKAAQAFTLGPQLSCEAKARPTVGFGVRGLGAERPLTLAARESAPDAASPAAVSSLSL